MLRGGVYIDKVRQKNRLFQTEGHSSFRQNDIKTYWFKDILLRQRNIGTRIVITKGQKEGNALLHLRRAFRLIQESLSLHQRNALFI